DGPGGPATCSEFKPGADLSALDFGVDASIKGEFGVFAQASSDFSAAAAKSVADTTLACRNIAVGLGAAQADQAAADAKKGSDAAKAWCDLTAAQITASFGASGKFAAAGSITISSASPRCSLPIAPWSA